MLSRDRLVGPWAGMPVAWKEDLSFDEDAYRADVERACKAGVPGVYTGGTTGEFYAVEFDEFKAVARATVEECRRCGTPVMIGVTSTYTLGAQRRAAFAAELRADAVQTALPFWMEMDDREVVPFFRDVVGACPGLAMNPRVILHMFALLRNKRWAELAPWCEKLRRLGSEGLKPFGERGFTDTAYDHMQGKAAGFLRMAARSRGTYISATDEDVAALRAWLSQNVPELLQL